MLRELIVPFNSAPKMSATKCVVDKSVGFLLKNWCSLSLEAASLDSTKLHEWNEIQAQQVSRMLSLCCNFPTAKSIWISQLYPQNQELGDFFPKQICAADKTRLEQNRHVNNIKDDPHDTFKPLTWKWHIAMMKDIASNMIITLQDSKPYIQYLYNLNCRTYCVFNGILVSASILRHQLPSHCIYIVLIRIFGMDRYWIF